ncbi:MAG TPA: AhpC/TSA family protein [Candidatus Bacteroides avicola]|uniref:AhpC/TSA family protein n=1 Tax=Candidatus Bacteroides avicola TaxID=2838468 RepID=A0A9D2HV20_9BACE|nr:AhpC/TSA family protein [Candidatus Bacteroides avicola]
MKKNLLTMLAGTALLCACQPATQSTGSIDIELDEMKGDTLIVGSYLISDLNQNNLKADTVLPGQTTYTYTAETDSCVYKVCVVSAGESGKGIVLALLPGEQIKLTGSLNDWQVTGSPLNATYASIQKACLPYIEKMDSLEEIMTNDIYRNEYLPTWHQMDSLQADYIRQHPDDDLSLFILEEIRGKWIDELYPTLTERVKNGPFAPIAQAFEKGFQRRKIFEANKKKIVEGAEAPDFTLNDLQGKPFTLSSLRGKYVVMDFWASWCGACIQEMPDMKKYYEKHKDKMQIVGIACNDKEKDWKAAVEKHEIPWLHVRSTDDSDVSLLYAIQAYPTKIVVDPEGKIAKIFVGEGPALYEYLDKLFH